MQLTAEQMVRSLGIQYPVALAWLPSVQAALDRFVIADMHEVAMFIAQTGHESDSFTRLVENLNYSVTALLANFHTHFSGPADAGKYARRPEKIANRVYSNRMGNGDEASGDGWKFRGRGLIQITGRKNYRACGEALGMDLESDPDKLLIPRYAALSAGWFWSANGCAGPARRSDVPVVTRIINGGLNGLGDRMKRFTDALEALQPAPSPNPI